MGKPAGDSIPVDRSPTERAHAYVRIYARTDGRTTRKHNVVDPIHIDEQAYQTQNSKGIAVLGTERCSAAGSALLWIKLLQWRSIPVKDNAVAENWAQN